MAFTLTSDAIKEGEPIAAKYTCDGADVSPALAWTDPPAGTKSICLIMDDPDAPGGTWTHWLLWNLPETLRALPEGVAKSTEVPAGSRQGNNDFRKPGYGGPCPPPGAPHRYFFRLFALDATLSLSPGASRKEVDRALAGHKILGRAELMGRYSRKR